MYLDILKTLIKFELNLLKFGTFLKFIRFLIKYTSIKLLTLEGHIVGLATCRVELYSCRANFVYLNPAR